MSYNKEVLEQIAKIEETIPGMGTVEGIPSPNWEETMTLEQKMKNYNVPGLAITVIDNFEIAWSKSYGIIDSKSRKKVDEYTLFEAGSTSKIFTALAQGNIDNDALAHLKCAKRYDWGYYPVEQTVKSHIVGSVEYLEVHYWKFTRIVTHQVFL